MPDSAPINRTATIASVLVLIAAIVILAAVFDLGPFADEEATNNQFLTRGDEICADAHSGFGDQQQAQPKTAGEATQITKNLIELAQDELAEIRDLTPPPALREPLARYLEAREHGIELLKAGLAAAEDDDFGAYGGYQAKLAAGQLRRRRLAKDVGFTECSAPSVDRSELAQQAKAPRNSNLDRPNEVNNPPTEAP